jgi:hypothetical protein
MEETHLDATSSFEVLDEVIATVSGTLALAIPLVMERVLRPRYEDRFEELQINNRSRFVQTFEEALNRLKKMGNAVISPEDYGIMERLFSQWSGVKEGETKLDYLISRRKYLFVAWMISMLMAVLDLGFPSTVVINVQLAQLSLAVFTLVSFYSIYYAVRVFQLDEQISTYYEQVHSSAEPPQFAPSKNVEMHPVAKEANLPTICLERDNIPTLKDKLVHALKENDIAFEIQPRLAFFDDEKRMRFPDFVVQSSKNPRYFIEVEGRLSREASYPIAYLGRFLEERYPRIPVILLADSIAPDARSILSQTFNYIFDSNEIDKLVSLLRQ